LYTCHCVAVGGDALTADPWPLGDVQVGFTSVYDIQTLGQGDKSKTTRYDILANIYFFFSIFFLIYI
jgi:hypothetical protein